MTFYRIAPLRRCIEKQNSPKMAVDLSNNSVWLYSVSIDVLAGILQLVLDRPLIDGLCELLFDSLGMSETRFEVAASQRHRLVDMYGLRQLGEVPAAAEPTQSLIPMDVEHRFLPVLLNGRGKQGQPVLSEAMVELLWQNRLTRQQCPISIGGRQMAGYGWGLTGRVMVEPGQALQLTAHGEGGWAGAASTHFWVDRQRNSHGIVMAQFLGSSIPLGPDMQSAAYTHNV